MYKTAYTKTEYGYVNSLALPTINYNTYRGIGRPRTVDYRLTLQRGKDGNVSARVFKTKNVKKDQHSLEVEIKAVLFLTFTSLITLYFTFQVIANLILKGGAL